MASSSERQPELEALLDYLKRSRGFDFTGYKRTSLARRIQKRMQGIGVDGYGRYRRYLERNPGEFEELFDTILINVTAFFRDADAWDYLRAEIVPQLVAEKEPTEPIRVWSAGCASGEEAYSLAIILAEAMAPDEFRERVKIYATDVDESALTTARHATYAAKDVESLPPSLVEKYFERSDARYLLRKDLRRSVVFGRNDLIQDAPISRIDLLTCRNTLMYFDAPTQARILSRFCFALNDGGYLFLGRAETLLTQTTTLTPVDLKRRVFQKVTRGSGAHTVLPLRGDAGMAPRWFDVEVTSLHSDEGALVVPTNEELQSTVEQLETANEELYSTNEELETMNEQLQSANEELRTMNDELQMRSNELDQLNRFLEQIFTSLQHGVAVVDPDVRVLVWNRKAEDLWGVPADQVQGTNFLDLDIGLPVDQLRQPIRDVLANGDGAVQETLVPATNRRGRRVQCRVVCAPLVGRDGSDAQGVIISMEEIEAQA